MGKIIDFLLSKNWEEYQRIQLYKEIGNNLTKKEFFEKLKKLN